MVVKPGSLLPQTRSVFIEKAKPWSDGFAVSNPMTKCYAQSTGDSLGMFHVQPHVSTCHEYGCLKLQRTREAMITEQTSLEDWRWKL